MNKSAKQNKVAKKANQVKTNFVDNRNPRARLAGQSYYLASIFDPLMNDGCKIPDLVTVPSATTQCIQRFQQAVGSAGVAAIQVQFGRTLTATGDIWTSAAGSATTAPTWNAVTPKAYATAMSTNAQAKRLVSGAIYYEYQGAPLNRKGRAICNFDPPVTSVTNPPTASVSTDLLTRPYCVDLNVADRPSGMVRYIPQDSDALTYSATNNTRLYGAGTIFIDGANVGDIVEFTIVENYEFVPVSSQLSLITPSPSISDPLEMSLAANAISSIPEFPVAQPPRDPLTQTLGPEQVGLTASRAKNGVRVHSPSESSHTGREPTFFERMVGGIKKAIPGVKKALAFGIDLATILSPLL